MKLMARVALVAFLFAMFTGMAWADSNVPPQESKLPDEVQKQRTDLAQAGTAKFTGAGAGAGMGLAAIGAGIGIGLIGHSALAGIARQPEQAGAIRGTMILMAALVEGVALIAVVFCLVLSFVA
jgi:F-type H+-transporting ATPase subunit c